MMYTAFPRADIVSVMGRGVSLQQNTHRAMDRPFCNFQHSLRIQRMADLSRALKFLVVGFVHVYDHQRKTEKDSTADFRSKKKRKGDRQTLIITVAKGLATCLLSFYELLGEQQ